MVIKQLIDFLNTNDKDFIQSIWEICLVVFECQANQITEHNLTTFLQTLFSLADKSSALSSSLSSFLIRLPQSLSPRLHHTLLTAFIDIFQSTHSSRIFVLQALTSLVGLEGEIGSDSLVDSLVTTLVDPSEMYRETAERSMFLIATSYPSVIPTWIHQLLPALQTQIQVVEASHEIHVRFPFSIKCSMTLLQVSHD